MIKKYWKIVILVIASLVIGWAYAQTANADSLRVTAGVDVGSDLSEVSVGDMRIGTELRLDPHKLLRVEVDAETGWTDGEYDKTVATAVGAYVMPIRGKVDFGCGARTGVNIDGRTALAVNTSNRYWVGCLAETKW